MRSSIDNASLTTDFYFKVSNYLTDEMEIASPQEDWHFVKTNIDDSLQLSELCEHLGNIIIAVAEQITRDYFLLALEGYDG